MRDDKSSWQQIQEVFQAALELGSEERGTFLDTACGEDAELRVRVDELLAAHESRESFLDASPPPQFLADMADASTTRVEQSLVGVRIGSYKVGRILASGGMGTVYEAIQEHPRRKIALKVLKRSLLSPESLERFEHEWQILALLRHPGIAQVYDAGIHTDDDGAASLPYFAMELVQGEPLNEYVANCQPDLRERLEVFSKLCDAVQHAHQKGVIHRDIKPRNICLDGDGEPKVLDFGIARSPVADLSSSTLKADAEFLLGTVPYMSPEQTEGDSALLDTRSDIYSLGVVLYELLTGKLPYNLDNKTVSEAFHIIRATEAEPPGAVSRSLRGDLQTIVLKALEKQKRLRYASAFDLATDIRRHLRGEPILARGPIVTYRALKYVKKHRVPAALIGLLLVLVAAFGSIWFVQRSRMTALEQDIIAARRREEEARVDARKARDDLKKADRLGGDGSARTGRLDYAARVFSADVALRENRVLEGRIALQKANPAARGWEWYYLQSHLDPSLETLLTEDGVVWSTRFSRDGRYLASADDRGRIRMWDFERRQILAVHEEAHAGEVRALAFGPRHLLASGGYHDRLVKLWHVAANGLAPLASLEGHGNHVNAVAVSPDGERVVSASTDGTARIWDVAEKRAIHSLEHGWDVFDVDFGSEGREVVTSCRDNRLRIWSAVDGKLLETIDAMPRTRGDIFRHRWPVAFARGGRLLVAGCHTGEVKIWDRDTLELRVTMWGHETGVWSLDSDLAGSRLVSASHDTTIRIWHIDTGRELHRFRGHTHPVFGLSLHAGGALVASGSGDGTLRLWDPEGSHLSRASSGHGDEIIALAVDPGGKWVATGGTYGTIHTWDANTLEMVARMVDHRRAVGDLAFSPNGDRLVSASEDGTARVWDPETGRPILLLQGHGDQVLSVAFHPERPMVASACRDGIVKFWSTQTGRVIKTFRAHAHATQHVRFSPDGKLLTTGSHHGMIRLWDVDSGLELKSIQPERSVVSCLVFSPDGLRIAASLNEGRICIWDVATGELRCSWDGHQETTFSIAFSPDGRRLVTGGTDAMVRLWDASTGEPLLRLAGHRSWIFGAEFDATGRRLYGAGSDKTLRVWDTAPAGERIPPLRDLVDRQNRVRPLVDRLFDEARTLPEVLKALDADASLDAASRLTAKRLATARVSP